MLIAAETLREFLYESDKSQVVNALESLVAASESGRASIILSDGEQICNIYADSKGGEVDKYLLNLGCIGKLVSATALLCLLGDSETTLDSKICHLLGVEIDDWRGQIKVQHLLEHTHGLDEPAPWRKPMLSNGQIDARAVLNGVGAYPLAPVGEQFSYSNVGSWLVGALLEARTGVRYVEVVRELFPTILPRLRRDDSLCPATGRGISVYAEEFLKVLVRATSFNHKGPSGKVRLSSGRVSPHKGWHPTEVGVCLGWKAYKNGWYGYKSAPPRAPTITLRVSPEAGVGFLAWSEGIHPWRFLGRVFSSELFEFPRFAEVGVAGARNDIRSASFAPGIYERMDSDIIITADASGAWIAARTKPIGQTESVSYTARLHPFDSDRYLVTPPIAVLNLNILQFIRDRSGGVSHVWNTGRLWRRAADRVDASEEFSVQQ